MARVVQEDSRAGRRPGTVAQGARPRWMLSRAGVINVYQYGDETIEFGGGRLLLRGVNGSGKSTAMNMLLPFLLDGDVRRIDAAGEQTGVLQSWMLSGREESSLQPVGYLWLEVEKDGEYLSFGCGIRASRSADSVSTWWFITSHRPGIDLHLVEGRVPVSRDVLRGLIAPDLVFGQEERAAYRAELGRRIFGGADIEEHLHLLRIVRNPRVGDRLDTELPQYLQNALPRLSEGALDDAAQPLEDLDEHRSHITELRRTAEVLEALHITYRDYARTELHRHCDNTVTSVDSFRICSRNEDKAGKAHTEAQERERSSRDSKRSLEAQIESIQARITALRDSDAYKSGSQLNELKDLVRVLKQRVREAEEDLRSRQDALQVAAERLRGGHAEAQSTHKALGQTLSNLATASLQFRLSARPPGTPMLTAHPESAPDLPLAPVAGVETGVAERELTMLIESARQRTDEVGAVEEAVGLIDPAERALRDAERAADQARLEQQQLESALAAARDDFQRSIAQWQSAAAAWLERLQRHLADHGLPAIDRPESLDRLADELLAEHRVAAPLEELITPAIEHHESQRAHTEAALERQTQAVDELLAKAAELAAKQLPDPPLLPWQQRSARCLAEVVDFADTLGPDSRAGLEAALEASGLLSAEVEGDGALRLASGQLVLMGSGRVSAPLADLLKVDVPRDAPKQMRRGLERILAGISTDLTSDAGTAVSVGGDFRIGSLRGRWSKSEAEHIGVSARRAALERQRAEIARQVEESRSEQQRLAALLKDIQATLGEAQMLRKEIPSEQDLHTRLWRRKAAEAALDRAEEHLQSCLDRVIEASEKHAAAIAHARETAKRLLLPVAPAELARFRDELRQIMGDCSTARDQLRGLKQAVERWRQQAEDWHGARDAESGARERRNSAQRDLLPQETRLETLDAQIGASYAQAVAKVEGEKALLEQARHDLRMCEDALAQALQDAASRQTEHQQAIGAREQAAAECLKTLCVLRQVLALPGLAEAAIEPPAAATGTAAPGEPLPAPDAGPAVFPAFDDTVAGARALAETVRSQVPRPDGPTSAESVRKSIRARRDSIGAGWDAEDRQPDPALPLTVEVIGPDAQSAPLPAAANTVRASLNRMESLLSAKQQQALRNLLQGLVAREIADKMHAAEQMIERMNGRLISVTTSHGIGVRLQWKLRDDLDSALAPTIGLLAKTPDLRTAEEDQRLSAALGARISEARREDPSTAYSDLIARVLDYREWHRLKIYLHRPGHDPELLTRRTALSEGEKKMVTYLPMFAAVAASCDSLAEVSPDALRFVLLDDAFNKVSEDNHGKLFGLLVELDLDFIVTSERLWGTHDTVPDLAITEVIRDAGYQTIVLEHSRWNGRHLELVR